MNLGNSGVSLRSIDEAYGASADLYKDVLGVKANAAPEQIQRAYFARRNELFTLLQGMEHDDQDSITASHHFHAQRKMQAVQMTMRILGDPELRLQYDDIRHERLDGVSRKKAQLRNSSRSSNKPNTRTSSTTHHTRQASPTEAVKSTTTKKHRLVTPEPLPKPAYNYSETEDEDDDDTRQERSTVDQTYDEEFTIMSDASNRSEGTLTVAQPRGVIGRVKDEVFGAMEDTATSFAQVFNAFTLQEEDIKAVTKRIDKAARQMRTSL